MSFTNDYQWGDLKADPRDLVERFFDAHVYVTNWMAATFMVRLPIEALPQKMAEAMEVEDVLDFDATQTHWVITWSLDESEDYERFGMKDGQGWMARLAPVRDELLRGDIRSLYVGWLAAVTRGMVDEEELEPLPVEGMGNLTAAQVALAEFLEVDEDLLAGAGIGSPTLQDKGPSQKEMDDWLDGLPREDVLALLKLLMEGQSLQAERTLRNRFSAWRRGLVGDRDEAPKRTVEELWKNAETAERIRLEQEKREREKLDAKRRKECDAYLKALAKDFPKAWSNVRQNAERGSGLAYDEACSALVDLSEAYSVHATPIAFRQDLSKFMADHARRKALVQRLVKAGVWHEK